VVVRFVVIFGGRSPNFVRNTGYVEIIMERLVADVPGCIYCSSEEFRLELLKYFFIRQIIVHSEHGESLKSRKLTTC
jgi:hypothetical protein